VIGQSNQKLGVFARGSARIAAGILAALFCAAAGAQGMHKCKDAKGKITYAGNECELMGLESAGEITGKASVAPAFKAPPGSRSPSRPDRPATTASQSPAKPPAEGGRRCFAVKTAKGTITRCNDRPDTEPDPSSK
jgi:hypothetical protein